MFGSTIFAVELCQILRHVNTAFSIMDCELLQDSLFESIQTNLDFIRYKLP